MALGTRWYASRIRAITTAIPSRAHALAAAQAAGIGAKRIKSRGTGALARDVAIPKSSGLMRSLVGSNLPYAAMENWGGIIRPRRAKRLLIRGARGGTRSTSGGAIVASADQVTHRGKNYLEAARNAYPPLFIRNLKRMMPG